MISHKKISFTAIALAAALATVNSLNLDSQLAPNYQLPLEALFGDDPQQKEQDEEKWTGASAHDWTKQWCESYPYHNYGGSCP